MLALIKSLWWYGFLTTWSMIWMASAVGNWQRGTAAPSEWFYPTIFTGHVVTVLLNFVLLLRRRSAERAQVASGG